MALVFDSSISRPTVLEGFQLEFTFRKFGISIMLLHYLQYARCAAEHSYYPTLMQENINRLDEKSYINCIVPALAHG